MRARHCAICVLFSLINFDLGRSAVTANLGHAFGFGITHRFASILIPKLGQIDFGTGARAMRQHILSVIFVACAVLGFGSVAAPERAVAQVSCPAADGSTAAVSEVTRLRYLNGRSTQECEAASSPGDFYINSPGNTSQINRFYLWLPGASVSAVGNPAKITLHNSTVTAVVCTGATTGGIGTAVGTIELEPDESCELHVFWEKGTDDVSFTGGTLSRIGDAYSIDSNGILAGDIFGGTAATVAAIDVERNGVSFSDGDTDDQGTQTAGTPITLTYTIYNTGSEELTINYIESTNEQNLQAPVTFANPLDSTDDLGTNRQIPIGGSFEFTATFTPDDPTDFSFDLNIGTPATADEIFNVIVSGSDSTVSATMSGPQVIARTQRIISNFMGRRASQIVGKEPDLTKRLGDGGKSSGGDGPVSVTGEGTAGNNNLAFATSLRQAIGSTQVAKRKRMGESPSRMALGARQEGRQSGSLKDASQDGQALDDLIPQPQPRLGLWAEGTWARVDDDTAKSDFGLLYVGADYRFRDGLVVGLIAQFDRTDEEDDANDYAIEGKGWMVGPYVVARLSANLIFDARAAWGKSNNEVSPYNTYTDDFDGQRKLLRGRLTGDFSFGGVHVAPHIGVIYFSEEQKAYTDSNGYAIGAQTVELGRLTFGPKFSTAFKRSDGVTIAPFVAINGIWDFKRTDQVDIDTGFAVTGSDKFRARTEAGLSIRLPQGVAITGEGFYDGIGADGYNAYGGSLKVGVPF